MTKSNERFEILLEEIRDKVQLVDEGHEVIRQEIQGMKVELKQDIALLNKKIDTVHSNLKNEIKTTAGMLDYEIKEVGRKLDEHIKVPHRV